MQFITARISLKRLPRYIEIAKSIPWPEGVVLGGLRRDARLSNSSKAFMMVLVGSGHPFHQTKMSGCNESHVPLSWGLNFTEACLRAGLPAFMLRDRSVRKTPFEVTKQLRTSRHTIRLNAFKEIISEITCDSYPDDAWAVCHSYPFKRALDDTRSPHVFIKNRQNRWYLADGFEVHVAKDFAEQFSEGCLSMGLQPPLFEMHD